MSIQGLHEAVLAHLGPEITGGSFAPGDVIRLDQIESRFGVSRTVARESIKMLESLHMVESRRRVGIVVRPVSSWDLYSPRVIGWRLEGAKRQEQLSSIAQLRLGMEPLAAVLACSRATADQCATLMGSVAGMMAAAQERNFEAYVRHDVTFHTTLLQASGNEMIAALAPCIEQVLTHRAYVELLPSGFRAHDLEAHREVAVAVSMGDRAAAEEAMRGIALETGRVVDGPNAGVDAFAGGGVRTV